jgi:hypothetical protein
MIKKPYISHDKFQQIAVNLENANKKIELLEYQLSKKELMISQQEKRIKFYMHDFRWLITISLLLGASFGWISRGML